MNVSLELHLAIGAVPADVLQRRLRLASLDFRPRQEGFTTVEVPGPMKTQEAAQPSHAIHAVAVCCGRVRGGSALSFFSIGQISRISGSQMRASASSMSSCREPGNG